MADLNQEQNRAINATDGQNMKQYLDLYRERNHVSTQGSDEPAMRLQDVRDLKSLSNARRSADTQYGAVNHVS